MPVRRLFVSLFAIVAVALVPVAAPSSAQADELPPAAAKAYKKLKKKLVDKDAEGFQKVIGKFVEDHGAQLKRGVDKLAEAFTTADADADGKLSKSELGNFEIQELFTLDPGPAVDGAGEGSAGCKSDADCDPGYHCHRHQGENGTCAINGT